MTTGNSPASGAPLMCVLRCVCVNVNTTDATAGATALLLPAQNSLSREHHNYRYANFATGQRPRGGVSREQGRRVARWKPGSMLDEEAPCRAEPRNLTTYSGSSLSS